MDQVLNFNQIKSGLVVLFIVMALGIAYISQKNRVTYIKKDCSLTTDKLTRIYDGGEAFDFSVDYEYYVNNDRYGGTVEIQPDDKKNVLKLKSKVETNNYFVWVIYSNEANDSTIFNARKGRPTIL